ncbi:uncharacterized protein LOC115874566 isoform X2 [Sitophilus oryzae]|uniref:Uncharacterized protein LOC115874566 isoform X2 n=1 Tax=Sitophilus oryzae TaxID=7048 RepID=A0A6J2X3C8_SITOR|nr:uncharacterized protein LOC115874566 isoform X2 [Sitophilus oryzae]
MSLMVISILDKIVWFLLAMVIATQALQIAGIVDTPSSSVDINFNEPVPIPVNPIHENINQINKDIAEENDRSPIIDAIFNTL